MNVQILLDFIGELEANGNYNAVFGKANSTHDLSQYTLSEIQRRQKLQAKRGSSATGKYQFMRTTLRGLRTRLLLPRSLKFTPELQERLALQLLKQRGLKRWVTRGASDDYAFMDRLSKEWASLPYHTGRSYYDGDGLNHALTTRKKFGEILKQARKA